MEEVRKEAGLSVEELEAQSVELLPEREEMHLRIRFNYAKAYAVQGAQAQSNFGIFVH